MKQVIILAGALAAVASAADKDLFLVPQIGHAIQGDMPFIGGLALEYGFDDNTDFGFKYEMGPADHSTVHMVQAFTQYTTLLGAIRPQYSFGLGFMGENTGGRNRNGFAMFGGVRMVAELSGQIQGFVGVNPKWVLVPENTEHAGASQGRGIMSVDLGVRIRLR